MFKLFEWIGTLMAIACVIDVVSDPKGVLHSIQQGPVPSLSHFNARLQGSPRTHKIHIERHKHQTAE